jgi:hypothetical protein
MYKRHYREDVGHSGYYCEYLEDDGKWCLTFLPLYKAIICRIVAGKKRFAFVKECNLHFIEDDTEVETD